MAVRVEKINACRVAIRPTSKMKKKKASGKVSAPEGGDPEQHGEATAHEEQQQVAGEDVGEESNGERDQAGEVRDRLDHEDEGLAERVHLLQPRRQPALEVGDHPLARIPSKW